EPAKVPSPPGAKSAVGPRSATGAAPAAATRAAAARTAARRRSSDRGSGLRAPQSRNSFAQEGAISGERLIHRFVRLINPPGEERVVAVVITVPRPQRAAQAVDRRDSAIGDRFFDLALLASQPTLTVRRVASICLFRSLSVAAIFAGSIFSIRRRASARSVITCAKGVSGAISASDLVSSSNCCSS